MPGSERIDAYSKAVKNFDLIQNLPPKNFDIDQFSPEQKKQFSKLCSESSYLKPIVYKNQISHFEINKKILRKNIIISCAKDIYRNQYLRNMHSKQEKATFVIINLVILMLSVLMTDSNALLLFIKDQFLLNIIAASGYFSLSLFFLVYYVSVNFIVLTIDVINDICLGIVEAHPNMIGSKA